MNVAIFERAADPNVAEQSVRVMAIFEANDPLAAWCDDTVDKLRAGNFDAIDIIGELSKGETEKKRFMGRC